MKTLKIFLSANGIFSSLMGVALILCTDDISGYIGQPKSELLLFILGMALIGFGVLVLLQVKFKNPLLIFVIIFMDALWVVGSVILLLYQPLKLSNDGIELIVIIAVVVFVFGIGQLAGLSQLKHNSRNKRSDIL